MKKKTDSDNKITFGAGCPTPLGVTEYGKEWNFAVSVPNAEKCCLTIVPEGEEQVSYVLDHSCRTGNVFSCRVHGLSGSRFTYSYEAFGKVFLDPYAGRMVACKEGGYLAAAVANQRFDWKEDRFPEHDYNDLILYKLHVRGFTMDHGSGVKHRGTYLGLTEKLNYLKELGINAVLLMPCTEFDERMTDGSFGAPKLTDLMKQKGIFQEKQEEVPEQKVNYWGYGTKTYYFAPKASYASNPECAAAEFKTMVQKFHANGIEVLMELSFLPEVSPGTVLDVLRFWVTEYHVDGFRLITENAPGHLLGTDPYLSRTKLIMDFWDTKAVYARDVTPVFRNLAVFNYSFMNTARRFLKGDEAQLVPFTEQMRQNPERTAVINCITDNNGFTLSDLYTYDLKHNEANREDNRDGSDINYSWNCGQEGPVRTRKINELRKRMMRNAMATLLLAQGTPMLLSGDEFCNTQFGNNNAYCQDNETGWLKWNRQKTAMEQLQTTKALILLRKEHPVFHNPIGLKMMDYASTGCPDLSYHGVRAWYPDYSYYSRTVGILLNGAYAQTERGKSDASFYLLYNMHWEAHEFDLPEPGEGEWQLMFLTSSTGECSGILMADCRTMVLQPRTAAVLIRRKKNLGK